MIPRRRTRQEANLHKINASTNPKFKFFLGLCELKLPTGGDNLPHPLDPEVLGVEMVAHIGLDDYIALTNIEWLGVNQMVTYMA